jgi:hypothetical protein
MGFSAPPGLSPDQALGGSQGLSIGDGLSFQQLGPVGENGILLENGTDFLMLENGIEILLQEK